MNRKKMRINTTLTQKYLMINYVIGILANINIRKNCNVLKINSGKMNYKVQFRNICNEYEIMCFGIIFFKIYKMISIESRQTYSTENMNFTWRKTLKLLRYFKRLVNWCFFLELNDFDIFNSRNLRLLLMFIPKNYST